MSDIGDLSSIDAARWGVEIGMEGGWVRVMESSDRDDAIRRAREEKAEKPESDIDVVAVDEDGLPIGRYDIGMIPAT
jgi:hypothetical protein